MTGTRRLSQALSEGDGISLVVEVDGAEAARRAEADGAEAVLVYSGGEERLVEIRAATTLPVLFFFDGQAVERIRGADACVVEGDADWLQRVHDELGGDFELAVRVSDDERLEEVLERFDPEILVLAAPREESLERLLDLHADVPAGKLVVAELPSLADTDVEELERAGVDAVLVGAAH